MKDAYRTSADRPPEDAPPPSPPWWTKQRIQVATGITILVGVVTGLGVLSYATGELAAFLTLATVLTVLLLVGVAMHLIIENWP